MKRRLGQIIAIIVLIAAAISTQPLQQTAAAVAFPAVQQGKVLEPGGSINSHRFGDAVAFSGDTMIASARDNTSTGKAYILVRSGSTWTQQAVFTPDAGDTQNAKYGYGQAVAISGDTAIVTEGYHRDNPNLKIYVYVRSGSTWTQQAKISAPPGVGENDWWGFSAALQGDTAIIGAHGTNNVAGAAYIYVRNGTTWSLQATLSQALPTYSYFGWSVDVDGNTAIVGAYGVNSYSGAVYVYLRTGTTWNLQATLTTPGSGFLGQSISLSGDTAVIGAWATNNYSGKAFAFVRSGATWTQQAELAPDEISESAYGFSVEVDGDVAVVGGIYKNSYAGALYVFTRTGTTWTQQRRLIHNDPFPLPNFPDEIGSNLALSGSTVVTGVSTKASHAGAVYVFASGAFTEPPRHYVGVYRPSTGVFYLRYSNNPAQAGADVAIVYGDSNYDPVIGDWNGDGLDTIGVFSKVDGTFHLRDANSSGAPDHVFLFGNPNDKPLSGRWNNSLTQDGVGVSRPANGIVFLRNSLSGGAADYSIVIGNPGDQALAGDWDGNGVDSIGVFTSNSRFQLTDNNAAPAATIEYNLKYGGNTGLPIAGDWTGLGRSGVGLYKTTGTILLLNYPVPLSVAYGDNDPKMDNAFVFGSPGDIPISGHWTSGSTPPPAQVSNRPSLQNLLVPVGQSGNTNAPTNGQAD